MVLGSCRRLLRDEHLAGDAFQAVFLVLARRAGAIRVDDSLGRWLHGVTRRVAARARMTARREVPAPAVMVRKAEDPAAAAVRAELVASSLWRSGGRASIARPWPSATSTA